MQPTDAVPAFNLRISIQGTEPEIWRQLQLPETITIPEFHRAIQAAFGWENRHLYGIRCIDIHGERRVIVGPDEAADDIDAEAASGVVLSELLDAQATGSADFEYEYDFGDSWTHTIELMGPAKLPAKSLRCTGGANRGPVEDAGGIGGYARFIEVLGDPGHPEYEDAAGWYKFATGQDATTFTPDVFDAGDLNARLDELALQLWPEPPTDGEVDAVVRSVHWFLSQVPSDGLPLTKDGYLKPAFVVEAFEALGLKDSWPGRANREAQTPPVLRFREQLQDWKLLRKSKGRLLLSPAGRKMHDGGRPLWDYLADAIGNPPDEAAVVVNGVVVRWMLDGTTPRWDERERVIADTLNVAGFRIKTGPVPVDVAREMYLHTRWTLNCLKLTVGGGHLTDLPKLTDGGRKFLLQVQGLLNGE
ncbi:plasmid pRiA4b ORF-3 family protein [Arthrobacter sp. NPDC058097]|uniref:plasmid pRiA4b ORF-3 family protein n=1 Tax=Arthrobacter sp. NPDC058097 TaxID=3346340 RepID=UPI0036DF6C41